MELGKATIAAMLFIFNCYPISKTRDVTHPEYNTVSQAAFEQEGGNNTEEFGHFWGRANPVQSGCRGV